MNKHNKKHVIFFFMFTDGLFDEVLLCFAIKVLNGSFWNLRFLYYGDRHVWELLVGRVSWHILLVDCLLFFVN